MSVCIVKPYVLQQQVIGREERRREEFISVQLFPMPRIKKKTLEVLLFYAIARYLAEPKLGKGNFNKSLGSRKLVREMQKVTKNV